MWRLSRDDLIRSGFDMKALAANTSEPDGSSDGLHINILEFVGMLIELWFVVIFINRSGPIPGGYIVSLIADNTSALSWFRYASRSHRPAVRALARFGMQLTLSCLHSLKISGKHLAGLLNTGADALSRPQDYPSWASAIKRHSPLERCQPYRVPYELRVALATMITAAETGVAYEPEMTKLLTLVPTTLSIGAESNSVRTSASRASRRTTRLR